MNFHFKYRQLLIYPLPIILLIWEFTAMHLHGPFFQSRSDPEYAYLLNALNIANLNFDRIGHVDHPGTPFQMLTAIFLRITHLFAGHGNISDDVIANPETYLSWSACYISFITAFLILWLGKISIQKEDNSTGAIILQSAPFLNILLIDLPSQYNPNRLLLICILVLIGICYKYIYDENYTEMKFAWHSGILSGIGFMTKFNYLPLLIIPFLLTGKNKNRLLFIGIFFATVIIIFIPIFSKFQNYTSFIKSVIFHNELYGRGSEQIIDLSSFFNNVHQIYQNHQPFFLLVLFSVLMYSFCIFKTSCKVKYKKELKFLLAFLITTTTGILMVAKHYKNSYLITIISLTALTFLINFQLIKTHFKIHYIAPVAIIILVLFIKPAIEKIIPLYKVRYKDMYETSSFYQYIRNNISRDDYILIRPSWIAGPMPENGLLHALCYIHKNHLYYSNLIKSYPNILTWENNDKPMKYFKTIDVNNESILRSGKNIYIISTKGKDSKEQGEYIERQAFQFGIVLSKDTLYSNHKRNEFIIRYNNPMGKVVQTIRCSFEQINNQIIYSDDGLYSMTGSYITDNTNTYNGYYSLELDSLHQNSPYFLIRNVAKDDYIEATIKRYYSAEETFNPGSLIIEFEADDHLDKITDIKYYTSPQIKEKWILLRLCAKINQQPLDGIVKIYFHYKGNRKTYIDDFIFIHINMTDR